MDFLNRLQQQLPERIIKPLSKLASVLVNSAASGAEMYGSASQPAPQEIVNGVLSFTPGLGDAISGYDAYDAAKKGNYGEAAMNAVGLIPGIPSIGTGIIAGMKTIKTEKQLAKAISEGEGNFIRWSRGQRLDKSRGGSRDYSSGSEHGAFSAVPINPDWANDQEWMARRVGEYGFLRMKDPKISPYIYSGKKVGTDSDGYDLISDIDAKYRIDPSLIDSLKARFRK